MTDWLKAFSTHETRSVGVSVEVMIWTVQPQLTPQRNKFFFFLMASFKTKKIFYEKKKLSLLSTVHAHRRGILACAHSVPVNASSVTSS